MWWQLRYIIGVKFWEIISSGVEDFGVLSKASKAINKEFEDDQSWKEGKAQFKSTAIIIIIGLILLSWIFS